jgi:hypothetical protein
MKEIIVGKFFPIFLAKFLLLCYYVSLLITARELWWVNKEILELTQGSTIDQ